MYQPGFAKEMEYFLISISDPWKQNIMVKHLGHDILNLVTDPMNYNPWEDEDGPLFSQLDNVLMPAEATDYLVKCFALLGICMS